jgi:glucan phosphoethanolaminetransferase (alkaline phosphatase superfamily)
MFFVSINLFKGALMSWELLGLILIAIIIVLLVVFRKNPYVKKYWKYAFILAPAVIVLTIRLIMIWKEKGQTATNAKDAKTLGNSIQQISTDLQETQMACAAQVAVAKTQSADKITELGAIKNDPDQTSRINRLAALIG